MDNYPKSSQVRSSSPMLVWMGRFLLILCAASLLTMPLTQRVWAWDRFLHGGHDFESVALLFLIFFSLVLVLSKHCKYCVAMLFAQWSCSGCEFSLSGMTGIALRGWAFQTNREPSPVLNIYSAPLQI